MRERHRAHAVGKPKALAFVELFRSAAASAASVARKLDVYDPAARAAIERAGLLEESTGRAWGKVWTAPPVMDVLERPLWSEARWYLAAVGAEDGLRNRIVNH